MEGPILHKPVLVDEVIRHLRLEPGSRVLDATVGGAGHASLILERIAPEGFLIGVDCDTNTLRIAEEKLKGFNGSYKLLHANFADIDEIMRGLGIDRVDAALFDLGLSSFQIEDGSRGFSFERDGFLDMRMDLSRGLHAYDIVNKGRGDVLEKIIRDFGDERYARRIAGAILEGRRKKPIKSTLELSEIIRKAVGRKYKRGRIHPATRTFQALRIAVNGELDNIRKALERVPDFLNAGARICVISFHSLEDRIVKNRFKELEKGGRGRVITKKPLPPTEQEIRENPRARSAKMRVFEING